MSDTNGNKVDSGVANSNSCNIRLVVQRYRKASLLIDEKEVVTVGSIGSSSKDGDASIESTASSLLGNITADQSVVSGHIGMLVYISFAKTATVQDVSKAAKTILNLPIQTEGAWGDGSNTKSIVQMAIDAMSKRKDGTKDKTICNVSIMLVPQANIIAKVKRNGKSVQYRDQIDKKNGENLYNLFLESVESLLTEEHQKQNQQSGTKSCTFATNHNSKGGAAVDASVLPKNYFSCLQSQQGEALYGSFDPTTGLPQTSADGTPLTKSATKRIRKLYDAHVKRHEKYLSKQQEQLKQQVEGTNITQAQETQQQNQNQNISDSNTTLDSVSQETRLDPSFVQLVAGTFGKRQGLEVLSDMGPFCHVIDI